MYRVHFPEVEADLLVSESKCMEGSSESKVPNVTSTSLYYRLNNTFTGCILQETKI